MQSIEILALFTGGIAITGSVVFAQTRRDAQLALEKVAALGERMRKQTVLIVQGREAIDQWAEDRDAMRAEVNRLNVQVGQLTARVNGHGHAHLTMVPGSAVPACYRSGCSELASERVEHCGYCLTHAKEAGLL